MRKLRPMVVGSLLRLAGACNNPYGTKLQYMPDMADQPTPRAIGNYIDPPVGVVATNAYFYAATPEEGEVLHVSPFAGSPDEAKHRENGKHLFGKFCEVCHGSTAKGGELSKIGDVFPPAPDLTLDLYRDRKDGFFFHRITFGSALMPEYGFRTDVKERWEIVLHLRELQKEGTKL